MRAGLLFSFLLFAAPARAQLPEVAAAIAQVNTDSLLHTVRALTGKIPVTLGGTQQYISSRAYTEPGNETAFQYLKSRLLSYGLAIDTVCVGARKSLVATLPGASAKAWMLGAHYDSKGAPGLPFAGADDNASGCAAVTEAARILSVSGPFPHPIQLAFWDEEEIGLLGSQDYQGYMDPDGLAGYINLDMIAYDGNGDGAVEVYSQPIAASPRLLAAAVQMPALYGIGLSSQANPAASFSSDYAPFWTGGHTAIGLAEDMDGDLNPCYHQPCDSVGLFDLGYFRKMAQLALATLLHSALDGPVGVSSGPTPSTLFEAKIAGTGAEAALLVQTKTSGDLTLSVRTATGALAGEARAAIRSAQPVYVPLPQVSSAGLYVVSTFFRSASGEAGRQTIRWIVF